MRPALTGSPMMPHELTEDTEVRSAAGVPGDRAPVRVWAALLIIGLLLLWAVPLDRLPYMCPMRVVSGLPCPTCGTGRAMHALAHLRISESIRYHPLVIPTVAYAAVMLLVAWARPDCWKRVARYQMLAVAVWVVAIVAVWLLRLRAGTIP